MGMYHSCSRRIRDERKVRRVSASPAAVSTAARARVRGAEALPTQIRRVCPARGRAAGLWESVPRRWPEVQGSLTQITPQPVDIRRPGEPCP